MTKREERGGPRKWIYSDLIDLLRLWIEGYAESTYSEFIDRGLSGWVILRGRFMLEETIADLNGYSAPDVRKKAASILERAGLAAVDIERVLKDHDSDDEFSLEYALLLATAARPKTSVVTLAGILISRGYVVDQQTFVDLFLQSAATEIHERIVDKEEYSALFHLLQDWRCKTLDVTFPELSEAIQKTMPVSN